MWAGELCAGCVGTRSLRQGESEIKYPQHESEMSLRQGSMAGTQRACEKHNNPLSHISKRRKSTPLELFYKIARCDVEGAEAREKNKSESAFAIYARVECAPALIGLNTFACAILADFRQRGEQTLHLCNSSPTLDFLRAYS